MECVPLVYFLGVASMVIGAMGFVVVVTSWATPALVSQLTKHANLGRYTWGRLSFYLCDTDNLQTFQRLVPW